MKVVLTMRVAVAFCLCFCLWRAEARVPFDVFLQVQSNDTPISGNVTEPLYSGWIEVLAFESGMENTNAILSRAPGRFREFTLVKKVDPATVELFRRLGPATVLPALKMVVAVRTTGRVELWDITGTNCFVTRQAFSAAAEGEVEERVTFAAAQFEWSYILVNPAAGPITEYFAYWNAITNVGTQLATRAPDYPGAQDSDHDGMPDAWEMFYGLKKGVADATLDSDGDGLDNLHEYLAHTDPLSSNSVLRITAIQKPGANTCTLTWRSVTNLTYRIFSATNPAGPYTPIQTVPSAGDGTTSRTIAAPGPLIFFRVGTP